MFLDEAYSTLEVDPSADERWVKKNFRWLVKFYHPDNPETGNAREFDRVVKAYRKITGDDS